jgi:16S rRNA (cytidine1402-2'-O)-methyltransferase
VFYESPFRVRRLFGELEQRFGSETTIVVARELTKVHEEVWHGSLAEALDHFTQPKGEFTVLVKLDASASLG